MDITKKLEPIKKPILAITLAALVIGGGAGIMASKPVKAEEFRNLGQCVEVCVKDPTYDSGLKCVLDCKAGVYNSTTGLPGGSSCTPGVDICASPYSCQDTVGNEEYICQ